MKDVATSHKKQLGGFFNGKSITIFKWLKYKSYLKATVRVKAKSSTKEQCQDIIDETNEFLVFKKTGATLVTMLHPLAEISMTE